MKRMIVLVLLFSVRLTHAQPPVNQLETFAWQNRLIIMHQIKHEGEVLALLKQQQHAIEDRDIVWMIINQDQMTSNHSVKMGEALIQQIQDRYQPQNNEVLLVGKDGGLKSRFSGLQLQAIFAEIDRMPMRQAEMRQNQSTDQ